MIKIWNILLNLNFLNVYLYAWPRLDQILGRQGSKAKDVYDSKQSLASRVVKTERQVSYFSTYNGVHFIKAKRRR